MDQDIPSRRRLGRPDWDQIIPSLKTYIDPGPTAPEEWAFFETGLPVAIAFSELIWPPFVVYDGMVFRGGEPVSSAFAANISSWMARFGGNRSEVERMLNHEHLIDLFVERQRDGSASQIMYMGRVLRETWEAKLKLDFPEKQFAVDLWAPVDAPICDWQITFYQRS